MDNAVGTREVCAILAHRYIRVRLKIIGNLETMHDSYLPTFLIIPLPIIFKRTHSMTESYSSVVCPGIQCTPKDNAIFGATSSLCYMEYTEL